MIKKPAMRVFLYYFFIYDSWFRISYKNILMKNFLWKIDEPDMKKLKQLLRDVRIALGKLILDSNKAVLDTAELQPIKSILFLRQDG